MEIYTEKRPWGEFEQLFANKECTLKILKILPNEELSLQYHELRDEYWKILSGTVNVIKGENKFKLYKDDEIFITKKTPHQAIANDTLVEILEISFGKFDESDIVRLKDKYGRVQS